VYEGIATLQELDTHYTFSDLLEAHEVLDLKYYAEAKANEDIKNGNS
jgi:hypothetical protein